MAKLTNIIKTTEQIYNELVSKGKYVLEDKTYYFDPNALYLVNGEVAPESSTSIFEVFPTMTSSTTFTLTQDEYNNIISDQYSLIKVNLGTSVLYTVKKYYRQETKTIILNSIFAFDLGGYTNFIIEVCSKNSTIEGKLMSFDTAFDKAKNEIDPPIIIPSTLKVQELLEAKQDKLIAGNNITIDSDGKTISATGGGVAPDLHNFTFSEGVTNGYFKYDRHDIADIYTTANQMTLGNFNDSLFFKGKDARPAYNAAGTQKELAFTSDLSNYISTDNLNNTLKDYAKTLEVENTLKDYVLNSDFKQLTVSVTELTTVTTNIKTQLDELTKTVGTKQDKLDQSQLDNIKDVPNKLDANGFYTEKSAANDYSYLYYSRGDYSVFSVDTSIPLEYNLDIGSEYFTNLNLNSKSRPKWNNNDLIIKSDLNNYVTNDTFSPINDYVNLLEQNEIPSINSQLTFLAQDLANKQDNLSKVQLDNISDVPNKLNANKFTTSYDEQEMVYTQTKLQSGILTNGISEDVIAVKSDKQNEEDIITIGNSETKLVLNGSETSPIYNNTALVTTNDLSTINSKATTQTTAVAASNHTHEITVTNNTNVLQFSSYQNGTLTLSLNSVVSNVTINPCASTVDVAAASHTHKLS